MVSLNNKPLNPEDIDLIGDDDSGVSNTSELLEVLLANAEGGTNPSKDEVVNAGIVSNSTKPTIGFKNSADNDQVIEGEIIDGATDDMNLETKVDRSISSLEKLTEKNAAINTTKQTSLQLANLNIDKIAI